MESNCCRFGVNYVITHVTVLAHFNEALLQFFVGIVYAELFKAIDLHCLKPVNVKNANKIILSWLLLRLDKTHRLLLQQASWVAVHTHSLTHWTSSQRFIASSYNPREEHLIDEFGKSISCWNGLWDSQRLLHFTIDGVDNAKAEAVVGWSFGVWLDIAVEQPKGFVKWSLSSTLWR